jgi:hypothetical protein
MEKRQTAADLVVLVSRQDRLASSPMVDDPDVELDRLGPALDPITPLRSA